MTNGHQAINQSGSSKAPTLARKLGPFDATMIVMGGIIGSGIFMNPHVVASVVHTPLLILGAWAVGGLIALAGAFIYAELAALRPEVGGQYAYIREALHPGLAFIYGWTLLLVVQSGGMAAVAVTFARYFIELFPASNSASSGGTICTRALARKSRTVATNSERLRGLDIWLPNSVNTQAVVSNRP